ncbi:hypothetical protein THER_1269 [Thermodesulfovibrio sp. N1]|nr:hypothetical protein THER_1269 [Thermodesulfovibrio sp. N1]
MVQMKQVEPRDFLIDVTQFISHMVQMKLIITERAIPKAPNLYPTWFR